MSQQPVGAHPADRPDSSADPGPDAVLSAERAHLDLAADCLAEMRTASTAVRDAGVDAWASERLGAARAERLLALAADPGVPAFFGRTDTDGVPGAETFHIGRRHVREAAGNPVVIDWRAPMSRPFHQAGAADPQGVARRRRFGFAARGRRRGAGPVPDAVPGGGPPAGRGSPDRAGRPVPGRAWTGRRCWPGWAGRTPRSGRSPAATATRRDAGSPDVRPVAALAGPLAEVVGRLAAAPAC